MGLWFLAASNESPLTTHYYEAQENFRQEGFGGLLPQKRSPKKARKLTPEVRLYLEGGARCF
jgi:hypothetical protein